MHSKKVENLIRNQKFFLLRQVIYVLYLSCLLPGTLLFHIYEEPL